MSDTTFSFSNWSFELFCRFENLSVLSLDEDLEHSEEDESSSIMVSATFKDFFGIKPCYLKQDASTMDASSEMDLNKLL